MNALIALIVILFSSIVTANPLHRIIAFGDSLSDNGNFYELTQHQVPRSPPYFKGRFSNGPVWVEQLADSYFPEDGAHHLLDYAIGGAAIADEEDNDTSFTLKHEINMYLLANQDKADPDSLFVIWIGANNYLAAPSETEKTLEQVNSGIKNGLEKLAKAGAQHVLVLNLPDLGKTPAAQQLDTQIQLTEFTKRHNEMLASSIKVLRTKYTDVQWLYFDSAQSVKKLLESPNEYGFTNTTDTCYNSVIENSSQQSLRVAAHVNIKKNIHKACEGYLFFDPVHSTAQAHQFIAEEVRKFLDSEGIEFVAYSRFADTQKI